MRAGYACRMDGMTRTVSAGGHSDSAGRSGGGAVGGGGVRLSVVAPAHNEEENVLPLVEQVGAACSGVEGGFEFVLVDDGSVDGTRAAIVSAMEGRPWLRCVAMTGTPEGKGNGQSAAFHAGFRAARGELIAVLDADLQNDPGEIPRLIAEMERTGADFVQGDRSAARRQGDAWIRQVGSVVGRVFRRMLLGDTITDTGCSLRLMKREIGLRLPLEFRGAHRFIPVTARQMGYRVVEVEVGHRARAAGETKYGAGVLTRALPGLVDCFAIRWMGNRRRPVTSEEVGGMAGDGTGVASETRSGAVEMKAGA